VSRRASASSFELELRTVFLYFVALVLIIVGAVARGECDIYRARVLAVMIPAAALSFGAGVIWYVLKRRVDQFLVSLLVVFATSLFGCYLASNMVHCSG
jgi:hypothetical protein